MRVVLFGVGSPVVADVEESCARAGWTIVAAIRNRDGPTLSDAGTRVVDVMAWHGDDPVLLPLFTPANRRTAWQEAVRRGARDFPALIDPTAITPRRLIIAEGVYVNAGSVLGAAVTLGRFAFVNRAASLGHHAEIGTFASIGPGVTLAGNVRVGAAAMIGAGAVVLPGVSIGAGAVVGAGSVVRHDVPDGGRWVGSGPAS